MNNRIPKILFLLLTLFAVSAFAADLTQAKRDGLIGERADGFLGLVINTAPADVQALVAEVNAKRLAEYERIADKNNLSVEQVQALAGKKAIEKTVSGNWVLENGGWTRK